MNVSELNKIVDLMEGKTVKFGINQMYIDDSVFVIEQYEYTDSNGVDMFSVVNAFSQLENALIQVQSLPQEAGF